MNEDAEFHCSVCQGAIDNPHFCFDWRIERLTVHEHEGKPVMTISCTSHAIHPGFIHNDYVLRAGRQTSRGPRDVWHGKEPLSLQSCQLGKRRN
ncbi:hypothetical protein [Noviherbaspirillum pedocola]|uniref:Uncharacterized protein n=1 Tax=Noviherbaspirillum pedocola TaxID=2801341 RepID=A0A934SVX3_9BURK|nr:hypothetical protein [Noviherbaspirillum pedocola]MBK4737806.1 hypothetical protein [Noviherbaspirillum pedocola]